MTDDPLLSDDLATLLGQFPNEALADIVGILSGHNSFTPLPSQRAYEAHKLPRSGDFTPHRGQIATEILWWGSHDVFRQVQGLPTWKDVAIQLAMHVKVDEPGRDPSHPAWKIELAVFHKLMEHWEKLTPEQRDAALKKAGGDLGAMKGAGVAAAGGLASLGAAPLAAHLAMRAAAGLVPVVGPVLAAVGVAWAAFDLAGPSYRVLQPTTVVIAWHRRRLRDERAASAFTV